MPDYPTQPVPASRHRLVVLISGSGTNLQAIIDSIAAGELHADIVLVLSNKADAKGLARAHAAGIPTATLNHRDFSDRAAFDQAMIELIDPVKPDTVVLAGFMRILSPAFVQHYHGRLLNIHPSLLPKYKGLDTHKRALEAKEHQHGCSIHFVTEELDGGPIIAQSRVAIAANDSEESLSKRVQEKEHLLYPLVLSWRADGRLKLTDHGVQLDDTLLGPHGMQVPASA